MNKKLPPDNVLAHAHATMDKRALYDGWASTYDDDVDLEGYVGPRSAVELLTGIAPEAAPVIDFGCGTGRAGELLAASGYIKIVGVDISEEMLAIASTRNCYQSVRQHDLCTPLQDDIRYQAAICVGVFAFGPATAAHIQHMTGVLAPAAPLVMTINDLAWEEHDWPQQLDDAQEAGGFTVEYINTVPYLLEKNIEAKLLIIRNTALDDPGNGEPAVDYSA